MKKNFIIRTLACLIIILFILPGCDQSPKKAAAPKIIRKKIQARTVPKTEAPEAKTVASAKPVMTPKPEIRQPATGAQATPQASIARKPEPDAGETAKPRPPVEPKSDLSIIPPPGTPKPAAETGSHQGTIASASRSAAEEPSSKMPPPYNPKGKIDPFEPLFKETPEVAVVRKERKKRTPRTPLEKIDIGQLKLVGIILAKSGNRALVEEASGKGYVIKTGTYLGTNSGKVVKIEKDKVIVAEEYEDVLGNVTTRNTEIKLPKPPGEL